MLTRRKSFGNGWRFRRMRSEEYMQRIANAFFSSVTMFGVGFAYFVLWAKA
jgi:hypothetical protein